MRNHGALNKYDHNFSGRNSRLDTLNAAVLNHKLTNYKNHLAQETNLQKFILANLKHCQVFKHIN